MVAVKQVKKYLSKNSLPDEKWKQFSYSDSNNPLHVWFISNKGRICKDMTIGIGHLHKDGYLRTGDMQGIHRIVAEAFIPKTKEDIKLNRNMIDHIDGDRTNNNVENLRWCTNRENCNFSNVKNRFRWTHELNPTVVNNGPPNKNMVLYNNGEYAKYFKEDQVPENWEKGRIKK